MAARCDRVMLLRGGLVEAFGPCSEVLGRPAARRDSPPPLRQNPVVTGSFGMAIRSTSRKISMGS
jgi:ATP-binding cassette subfamily C protein